MTGMRRWVGLALGLVLVAAGPSRACGGRSVGAASSLDCGRFAHEPKALRGITAAHNRVRARAGRHRGHALADLVWSCRLAHVAQAYAETLAKRGCRLKHSQNSYGENLYWSYGFTPSAQQIVASWASEGSCNDYARCGHYTQIVWPSTARLGCGVARCGREQIWVCNYDPPGNYRVDSHSSHR